MASSIVGNLIVRLAADIGSYESGMRKADKESKRRLRQIERRVQKFERNFRRSMTAAAGGVSLVSGALAVLVARQTQAFAQTEATASAIGVQVSTLQEYQYAAQRVGINADKMGDIMKDTADKIGDAYANGGGEALDVIENLGLSAENLIKLSPDRQIQAIADAMQDMPRGAQINVLESLGDEASRLLPLLADGGKRLRELRQEAQDLDVSMDAGEIQQMRDANEAIEQLRGTYDGLANRITIAATPAITEFTETLMDEDVQRGLENMASGIVTIIDNLSKAVSWFSRFGEAIGTTFGKMAAGSADPIERLNNDIKDLRAELDGLSNDDVFGQLGAAGVPGADTGPATGAEAERIRAEIKAKQQQLEQLQAMRRAAEEAANSIDVSALFNDAGIGVNAAFSIPDMPEVPKGGWKPKTKPGTTRKSEAAKRVEQLQKELALFGDLSRAEEARISLANGYYGQVTAGQAKAIVQYSEQLDQMAAAEKAEEERESAVKRVTQALATQREQAFAAYQERLNQIEQITEDEQKQAELRRRNWQQLSKDLGDQTDELGIFAKRASENIQDQLGNTLEDVLAGNFEGIANNWAAMLRQMAAQAAAARLNETIFGKGAGGSGSDNGLLGTVLSTVGSAVGSYFGGGAGGAQVGGSIAGDAPLSPEALSGINVPSIPGLATGGPAGPGSIHEVAEYGPEMLNSGGRSYLLMGKEGGYVSPAVHSAPAAMSGASATGSDGGNRSAVFNIEYNEVPGKSSEERAVDQDRFMERLKQQWRSWAVEDAQQRGAVSRAYQDTYGLKRQGA